MIRLPATVALCVLPTLAPADVTPAELWEEWQSGPIALSAASEATQGGALVLDGVTAELPQGGRMMIGRVTLAPEGEAVRVTASDSARLVARTGAEGELTAPDAELTVNGEPGALAYSLAAPSLALDWTDLPQDAPVSDLRLDLRDAQLAIESTEAGIAARIEAARGALATIGSEGGTEVAVEQNWIDPTIAFDGPLAVLAGIERPAPPDRLALRLTTSGTASQVVSDGPDGRITFQSESAGTTLDATLDAGRLDARQTARDTRLSVTREGLPLDDLTARIADLSVAIDAPAAPTETPEEAQLDLRLGGVTFSEQVWDLVDPGRRLPRDPATLRAALSVTGQLAGDAGALPPVALDRLDIDELHLDALGARADVEGRLDWDEAGDPLAPEGRISVELQGAEALVENLVAAGLLTEGQALFAGIGLGSFTHATGDTGGRAAEIVFGPDGAITVDGTALR